MVLLKKTPAVDGHATTKKKNFQGFFTKILNCQNFPKTTEFEIPVIEN